jgi:hypothetical protein
MRQARACAALLVLLATACGGSGSQYTITLEVQDAWIRLPGAECAGSIPYLFVHRTGPFQIVDRAGEVVASGELPGGVAVEAFHEDLEVPRVPTFCRFRIDAELPGPGDYRLVLERGSPLAFSVGSGPILLTIP